jgi:D-arginine dehydrogenase
LSTRFDVAIVGAGMAGASLAAELAPHCSVVLLEAEERPGYHATGRSAAFWAETYGGPLVQPLTSASGPWLAEHGFLGPRGALNLARAEDGARLDAFLERYAQAGVRVERVGRERIEAIVPGLRPQWREAAWEPDCRDIDVAGLHAHYLVEGRRAGVELRCRARLAEARHADGRWQVTTESGETLACDTLVDAAGAWADQVAERSGLRPLGITPLRRTIAQLRTAPAPPGTMPLVLGVAGGFYFKPENGRVWVSPHDETPSPPCDAAAEEIDVAEAVDRFEGVVDWRVEAVEHRWAGLRSFAPDRLPVIGRDPANPAFFWFAGQGGAGIQTAPAAARMAAQALLGLASDAMTAAFDPARYGPGRFGCG